MPPQLRLNAVAFVSPQNHPILIRTFAQPRQDEVKYHYIAHTSLDVIEERSKRTTLTPIYHLINIQHSTPCPVSAANATKSTDCYLGLLYVEDVAVYGYMTPLKVKIIIALELSDTVVKDADVITVRVFFWVHGGNFANNINRFSRRCTLPTVAQWQIRSSDSTYQWIVR